MNCRFQHTNIRVGAFIFSFMIDRLLEYLGEDLGAGDITSESIIPADAKGTAVITAKEDGMLAGVEEATELLEHFKLKYKILEKDGQTVKAGTEVIKIEGNLRDMLKLERLILNILGRMSGIATHTSKVADICKPYNVKVMATRKTTPGFRFYEKKAVEIGGGLPHRQGLYDGVLIKDNHLTHLSVREAIGKAKKQNPMVDVEVETSSLEDAAKAAEAGADILLLDNLTPREAAAIIEGLKKKALRDPVRIELSGGITHDNIEDYARAGADLISLGSLITSSKWLDLSMTTV